MTARFFGMVKAGGGRVIKRLVTNRKLQDELAALFRTQEKELFERYPRQVPFRPGDALEGDELFVVEGVRAPDDVRQAARSADLVATMTADDVDELRGLYCSLNAEGTHLLLQRFTSRQALSKNRLNLFASGSTFSRLDGAGLVLDDKLSCVVKGKSAYFRSYTNARIALPTIADAFSEATDDMLRAFAEHPLLDVGDPDAFVSSATGWTRRRVAMICNDDLLNRLGARTIKSRAALYGLALKIKRDGRSQKERLMFPVDRNDQRLVIKLLANELLHSELTEERFSVPGKRRLR